MGKEPQRGMTHHRTTRNLLVVAAAALLVATACSAGPAASSPTPASSEKPQQGGKIIQGDIADIATIQPILSADTSSSRISNLIYDGLIQQDYKNGEPKAKMAT
ncbi:MAG: hypothetical protein M3O99_10640, partial [Chloroflexota bacterium]|nr:hypothetical protein [Chloroflexota bacterium]